MPTKGYRYRSFQKRFVEVGLKNGFFCLFLKNVIFLAIWSYKNGISRTVERPAETTENKTKLKPNKYKRFSYFIVKTQVPEIFSRTSIYSI